jgi:hypothetical protein
MRRAGIWMIPIIGGLWLTGAALAQVPDDEEPGATSEELSPSRSGGAALADSADDTEMQGRDYQAPGVHVWIGRLPSKEEFQSAVTEARSQAQRRRPLMSDAPDFQNERIQVYLGRLPNPESLWNMRR